MPVGGRTRAPLMSRANLNKIPHARIAALEPPDLAPDLAPKYVANTYSAVRFNNAQNVSQSLLRSLFGQIDVDGSGELDRAEVRTMVIRLGREVTETEVDEAMSSMDEDKSGEVDFGEFQKWCPFLFNFILCL